MQVILAQFRGNSEKYNQQSNRSVPLVHEDCDLNPATKLLTMKAPQLFGVVTQ